LQELNLPPASYSKEITMEQEKKIPTVIECPRCQTKFDISALKKQIKQKIDAELDVILEKL